MNRILSIDEATSSGRGPIWLQDRGIKFAQCVMYDYEHSPVLQYKICTTLKWDRHLYRIGRQYGVSWRCFDKKPSESDLLMPFEEEKGA